MFKLPRAVEISLHDLIDNDLEGILDLLSEKATGSPLLQDITYRVVGCVPPHTLYIEVDGDDSAIEKEPDAEGWPSCGMGDCDQPSLYVDSAGVGYCGTHRDGGIGNPCLATRFADFDPWWLKSITDPRFEHLHYGEWPGDCAPPDDARPGWGLPAWGPKHKQDEREAGVPSEGSEFCAGCAAPLHGGLCDDDSCPFSTYTQKDARGWAGHPEHEAAKAEYNNDINEDR